MEAFFFLKVKITWKFLKLQINLWYLGYKALLAKYRSHNCVRFNLAVDGIDGKINGKADPWGMWYIVSCPVWSGWELQCNLHGHFSHKANVHHWEIFLWLVIPHSGFFFFFWYVKHRNYVERVITLQCQQYLNLLDGQNTT